jgi:hypothetical protein
MNSIYGIKELLWYLNSLLMEAVRVYEMFYFRPGQTFADQELVLIFPESCSQPHILIFSVVYGKTQEIYSNNNNILILVISK